MAIVAIILKDEKTHSEVEVRYEEPDNVIIDPDGNDLVNLYIKDLFSAVDLLKAAYWHDRNSPPNIEAVADQLDGQIPGQEQIEWGPANGGTIGE